MKFINKFAHSSNYGGTRKLSDIKYIVVHFTGNKGDTALNNCKYFQGPNRHASAHCFIDGSEVVYKSVSLKRVAWAVGGCYTLKNGAGSKYKVATNANSLSIEMCNCVGGVPADVYKDLVWLVTLMQITLSDTGMLTARTVQTHGLERITRDGTNLNQTLQAPQRKKQRKQEYMEKSLQKVTRLSLERVLVQNLRLLKKVASGIKLNTLSTVRQGIVQQLT